MRRQVQSLPDRLEARCAVDDLEPLSTLRSQLGWEEDADMFWGRVDTNLQAGKIRLLFVADVIPRELRRVSSS